MVEWIRAWTVVHETTQKLRIRLLLVAFGFLPVLSLMVATIVYRSPYYQAHLRSEWQARVAANLGVRVQASEFQILAPQQFRATDVSIFHPETDALIAKVTRIDGLMKPEGWSLILDKPLIDGQHINGMLELLHDGFLCKPRTRDSMLAISVPKGFAVKMEQTETKFSRVELLMRPTEQRSAILSKLWLDDQPFGEIQVQVVRDHSPTALATSIEIRSPKTWIACAPFADRLTVLNRLGPQARFRGTLRAEWGSHHWDSIAQGDIDQVDWSGVTSAVGSPLRGSGSISINQLNLRDGQILYAKGELECSKGTIQTAWVKKAAQWLELPSQWEKDLAERQSIDTLGIGFELGADGLRIAGRLPGPSQWPPVALKLSQATLCTPDHPIPLTNFVAAVQAVPGLEAPGATAVDLNAMHLASMLPWPTHPKPSGAEPTSTPSRLSQRDDQTQMR